MDKVYIVIVSAYNTDINSVHSNIKSANNTVVNIVNQWRKKEKIDVFYNDKGLAYTSNGSYRVEEMNVEDNTIIKYNPEDENKLCECGHPYYRHFDPYENMDFVGCKMAL